jgi:hypothetical protein
MAIYTAAACAGPFTYVSCDDDSGPGLMPQLTYVGAPGTTIWVRVWDPANNNSGQFNICATAPPSGAANNEPCFATPVTVNNTCNYFTGSTTGATLSATLPPNCGGFGTSPDVWYTFVAPPSGIAIIEGALGGTNTDPAIAVYTATACNGVFTQIACDDDAGFGLAPFLPLTNLTPGQTYYLRVWGFGSAVGTFNLCIHGPTSIPPGQCMYMLTLNDTGQEGWGTSSVGISINGGPFVQYTCTNTLDIFLIGLNVGNVLVVQYNASGANQTQNSYTLEYMPGAQDVFNSGSPPAAGIVFTQTVTCNPPPSPQSDCSGAATICNNQSFNNNSGGTGNVEDLNASNQGCLASGEQQGTWYFFSPSTSGTVAFTIIPSAAIDYDFAVWGPLSSATCPPVGPPLRCSYSGLTGNTGLGNGAVDFTEGAGGDKWVAPMTVTAGQIYILYVDNFSMTGQSFSLTWQLSNGASLDCTVLPMELLAFEATPLHQVVELSWSTASEKNTDRFDVERSVDGVEYELIGSIPGQGHTEAETHYVHQDRSPVDGVSYYRLKIVDRDGTFAYSPTVSVTYSGSVDDLLLFPNPGEDHLSVVTPAALPGARVMLRDVTGRTLITSAMQQDRCELNTMDLPTGIYAIEVVDLAGNLVSRNTWVKRWVSR